MVVAQSLEVALVEPAVRVEPEAQEVWVQLAQVVQEGQEGLVAQL